MFLGHFGVALAAKELAPRTSLGTLVLAAQFADLLWPIFLLAGLEQVHIAPGITRATPLDFVHYPITHSLVGQALWGLALGLLYFSLRRNTKSAVICWRLRGEPLVPRRYCAPARLACISSRAVCWPRIVEFPASHGGHRVRFAGPWSHALSARDSGERSYRSLRAVVPHGRASRCVGKQPVRSPATE